LIENFPCNSKSELERKEGEHIRATRCVNKIVAGRTQKEYREENKEKITSINKEWYQVNKEQIILKKKEYRKDNKTLIALKKKEYYDIHKEQTKQYKKQYYENNKTQILLKRKEYRLKKKASLNLIN
jgi:LmbE family N-acetylglucosaminyl deacetylase